MLRARTPVRPGVCDSERESLNLLVITYSNFGAFEGWGRAPGLITTLIDQTGARDVLEVGAGANPTLGAADVVARALRYTLNDVSEGELAKSGMEYHTLCQDFSARTIPKTLTSNFDFVFSRMVNEHVPDGETYHRNIFEVLRPGGIAVHLFSTLYTTPFLANRILPARISDQLLDAIAPRDRLTHGKFEAYYSWCRGPTAMMLRRYQRLGYEVLEYSGYFGHGYYDSRFPALARLERWKTNLLLQHPVPQLTSYAKVVLRKR